MRLGKLREGIREYQFYFDIVKFELLVIHMEMPYRQLETNMEGWGKLGLKVQRSYWL